MLEGFNVTVSTSTVASGSHMIKMRRTNRRGRLNLASLPFILHLQEPRVASLL